MPAPNTAGKGITLFIGGLISVGIVTALVLPGRQTTAAVKAAGNAGSGLLGTAIHG